MSRRKVREEGEETLTYEKYSADDNRGLDLQAPVSQQQQNVLAICKKIVTNQIISYFSTTCI